MNNAHSQQPEKLKHLFPVPKENKCPGPSKNFVKIFFHNLSDDDLESC